MLAYTIITLHVFGATASECSREDSRRARLIVNKQVAPRYSMHHLEIPTTCPLSPANDQYAAHEVMKRRLGSDWMCSVCGKSFKDEAGLESHLTTSHKVHKVEECLADHCELLRCEPIFGMHQDGGDRTCDEAHMSKLKSQCMDMVRESCVPTYLNADAKLKLEVSVQASICSYLTCEEYWTTHEDFDTGTHYYYTTYAIALCVLLTFLFIYFKIASRNIDSSMSFEQILADADKYERPKPALIPPDQDMEMRHRTTVVDRQWSENE